MMERILTAREFGRNPTEAFNMARVDGLLPPGLDRFEFFERPRLIKSSTLVARIDGAWEYLHGEPRLIYPKRSLEWLIERMGRATTLAAIDVYADPTNLLCFKLGQSEAREHRMRDLRMPTNFNLYLFVSLRSVPGES